MQQLAFQKFTDMILNERQGLNVMQAITATLEQKTDEESWVPISFAPRYQNTQEKKYLINELELLAVSWAVYRYKHYFLGKVFISTTDHFSRRWEQIK